MTKQLLNRRTFLRRASAAGTLLLPFSFPVNGAAIAPPDPLLQYIRDSIGKTLRPSADVDPSGKSIPLPYAFNVPCISVHFQNLFYYDTYFLNRGLIALGDRQQAENNVNNLLFLVNRLGFVPNSNRLDMTNRSQPPYLCMMVKDIYEANGNKEWLKSAYPLISKEYEFWITKRSTPYGLSRHYHDATPEYLSDFYEHLKKVRLPLDATEADEKRAIAGHRLAEAEAGYDFTPRFDGRCADFIPVDLNSNLYWYEVTMSGFAGVLKNGESKLWMDRATERKRLIDALLWNEARGLYLDYDMQNERPSENTSVATFHPLWAGCASAAQAESVKGNLKRFEYAHGVVPCEAALHEFTYQWDYPNSWPPHAMLIANALSNYHYAADADRIRAKYVNTVNTVFKSSGTLWEKYNAVEGNLNVNEEYKTPPMIGWTAGIYAYMRIVNRTRLG